MGIPGGWEHDKFHREPETAGGFCYGETCVRAEDSCILATSRRTWYYPGKTCRGKCKKPSRQRHDVSKCARGRHSGTLDSLDHRYNSGPLYTNITDKAASS